MYEHFEHTADMGIRVRASDLPTLFAEAADGLFAAIAESVPPLAAVVPRRITVKGIRYDYLLLDWLNELLYIFETRHELLGDFEVSIDAEGLTAVASSRPFVPERDRALHEVKAITYHGLRVEATNDGWLAEVIVDI